MKRTVVVIATCLVLVLLGSVSACSRNETSKRTFPNEPDGFRGVKWGEKLADRKDMDPTPQRSSRWMYDLKFYVDVEGHTKTTTEPPLGEVYLPSVVYGFWNGEFVCARGEYRGMRDYFKIRDIFKETFGPTEKQSFEQGQGYFWEGDKAMVYLNFETYRDAGSFYIASEDFLRKQKELEREKARKAGEKGL